MTIHDRTRLIGRLISFILLTTALPVQAFGPTDEEVAASMLALDVFRTPDKRNADEGWAYDAMRACTVQVHAGSTFGSGCIYSISEEDLIIVSNRHVVSNWAETALPDGELTTVEIEEAILNKSPLSRGYVIFYDGTAAVASLAGISEDYDVGFLRVDRRQIPDERIIHFRSIRLDDFFVPVAEEDDKIFAYESLDIAPTFTSRSISRLGNNSGIAQEIHAGSVIYPSAFIEQFQTTMLYVRCEALAGMSGGGLFDHHGRFLGLVTGGNERGEMICVRAMDVLAAAHVLLEK